MLALSLYPIRETDRNVSPRSRPVLGVADGKAELYSLRVNRELDYKLSLVAEAAGARLEVSKVRQSLFANRRAAEQPEEKTTQQVRVLVEDW